MAEIIDPENMRGGDGRGGGTGPKGLIPVFANNAVAANLLMILMLFGGFISALGLTAQVFPTIDPGLITVTVPYPGATPSEVEESITRRVEEAVFGIDGVKRVVSRAYENTGVVNVELKDFVDAAKVRNDVETAVEQIADFPPLDAEEPNIVSAESISGVMTLVVSSDLPEAQLRQGAEALEEQLLVLPSVNLVSMVGARDYEISIEMREQDLRRFGLSVQQVADAVRRSSLNLSSGELRTDAGDLLLRTNVKRERGEEFAGIVLRADPDGTILRLRDVANVRDGFVDVDLVSEYNGRQSVFLKVQKSEAEDALVIAGEIKEMLRSFEPPPGIDVDVWEDQTEILRDRLSLLVRNGLLGFALVFLFLVVMLDLRLAIWVAMGVPISLIGAFLFFDFFGVNIDMISLFALIIVLGIVVDDAIVVGENISAEQGTGKTAVEASIAGVRGVLPPVLVGVLTTMAAFAPLLFVTGTFGQILGVVPVVVITVLTMSLVEVFFILPAHLAHPGTWSRWPLDVLQQRVARGMVVLRDKMVLRLVDAGVRHRYFTVFWGITLMLIAYALLTTGTVRFIFFPSLEADSITSDIEFPTGTPFDVTNAAARKVLAAAEWVNQTTDYTAFKAISITIGGKLNAGGGGPRGDTGISVANNLATIEIQLNPEPIRTLSAKALETMWRERVGDIPGVESLTYEADFFGGGADVEYELAHQDEDTLNLAVADLKEAYRQTEAIYEIQDSEGLGKRQFDIELTPTGEAAGLTPADVARQLRHNFFGEEVHRIQRGRQELKVMVRYPQEQRRSTLDFFNVHIRLADGTEAPLPVVARVTESRSFSSINRIDGRRVITVSGDVDLNAATPTEVNDYIAANVVPELKDRYPGLLVTLAGLGRDQTEDLASLGNLMVVAIMVMFVLIASQLRSYTQPLVILIAVPFGAAGAVIGHYILGYYLSFISIFGIVALSGVVVNNSLVLIDRFNILPRTTDLSTHDAILQATRHRFRAVFLTTATTALALMPMLFETSIQAQFLIPMAVSLATGIVFASTILLFVVPSLVMIREDLHRLALRRPRPRAAKAA